MFINPIALGKAKIAYNFGLSERNRVKQYAPHHMPDSKREWSVQRNSVKNYLKYLRYIADKFEMPKFSKGHSTKNDLQNLFKIQLIISNQLTNFQLPS